MLGRQPFGAEDEEVALHLQPPPMAVRGLSVPVGCPLSPSGRRSAQPHRAVKPLQSRISEAAEQRVGGELRFTNTRLRLLPQAGRYGALRTCGMAQDAQASTALYTHMYMSAFNCQATPASTSAVYGRQSGGCSHTAAVQRASPSTPQCALTRSWQACGTHPSVCVAYAVVRPPPTASATAPLPARQSLAASKRGQRRGGRCCLARAPLTPGTWCRGLPHVGQGVAGLCLDGGHGTHTSIPVVNVSLRGALASRAERSG